MGRVASALDNAASESWTSTLEHEVLSRQTFDTKDQARRAIARFIDAYNHRRRHSSCEMLPPVAYETLLAETSCRRARPSSVNPASPPGAITAPAARLQPQSETLHGFGGSPPLRALANR
jgi:hypothetical protein